MKRKVMKNKVFILAGIVLLSAIAACSGSAEDDGLDTALDSVAEDGSETGSGEQANGGNGNEANAGNGNEASTSGESTGETGGTASSPPDAVSGASVSPAPAPAGDSGSTLVAAIPVPETQLAANLDVIKASPPGAYRLEWTVDSVSRPWDMSGFNTPVTIVIEGKGKYVTLEGGYNGKGSLLTVPDGVTVFLKDIAFEGCDTNTKSIVTVKSGGTLVMKDGAEIRGARRSPVDGGAVKIEAGGVFQMDGGAIRDNTGVSNGAVFISGGEFVMTGGKISGNQSSNCGGVFMYNGGSFIMTGGEISGNISKNYAGGVLVNGGNFEMRGGSIKNNTCHLYGGGVFIGYYSHLSGTSSGVFVQKGGTISGNRSAGGGGGVSLRGSSAVYVLKGGEVSGNLAVPDDSIDPYGGGGVFVQDGGIFIFSDGSIKNNETQYELWGGGGILVYAKDAEGISAGVDAVSGASGGGGSSSLGGGTTYRPGITLSGGVISGNTAGNGKGAGIYLGTGDFTLTEAPAITDAVCVEYQPTAAQHILIDGGFTGTTVSMDLRGNQGGITFVGNWMRPLLGMSGGGTIPATVRSRFALKTFTPYTPPPGPANISAYTISEKGLLVK
jgi:hypothetical protein